MSCFLPNGTKRPILDVNSEYLVYLWNFPNHLPMQDIRKDVFRRYGFVRFIETFEAWKYKKIGQIILEFTEQKEMDTFIEAFERKEVLNNFEPPIEFICLQKMGKQKFFDYVKEWSGVDLLSCRGIPPSFNRNSRNPSSSFSSPRPPSNNGIFKHMDDQKSQRSSNIFSRVSVEKENDSEVGEHLRQFGGRGRGGTGSFGGKSSTENNTNNNNTNNNSWGRDENKNSKWNSRDRSSSFGGRQNGSNNSRQYNKGNDIGNNVDDKVKENSTDNNNRQFGAAGGFGTRRGSSKRGRIPKPYASEWENCVISPRNQQIQNLEDQNKFGQENLNNNGRSVSSMSSPSSLTKESSASVNNVEDSNTQIVWQKLKVTTSTINLEENGKDVEINDNINSNGVKKDDKKEEKNKNKEEKEEGELSDEEEIKNLSNTSTLSICSTTSLATIRRLSQSPNKNINNNFEEAETRPSSTTHFNKYRTKPPSLASEDDEGRNTMLIRKIKLGFSIERILEDLQNFGDIIEYKQLDETTAIFKFLDASEAELAAKVVSKNSNLFGTMAIFELQR